MGIDVLTDTTRGVATYGNSNCEVLVARALDQLAPALLPGRTADEVYAALGRALTALEAEHVVLAPPFEDSFVRSVWLRGVPPAAAVAALAPLDAPGHPVEAARLADVRVAVRELLACAGRAAVMEWLPLSSEMDDCGVLLVGDASGSTPTPTADRLVRLAANVLAAQAESHRLRELGEQAVGLLGSMVGINSPDWAGHAEQVSAYAVLIAERLAMPAAQIELLRLAALLHDIGMVGIPNSVLNKPAPLNRAERAMVQTHVGQGAQLLARAEGLRRTTPLVRHHHERYDGMGYPDGLAGDAIPLGARVLAVADAFQAMTSERAYRGKLTLEQAKAELQAGSGSQFDAKIVDVLLEALV